MAKQLEITHKAEDRDVVDRLTSVSKSFGGTHPDNLYGEAASEITLLRKTLAKCADDYEQMSLHKTAATLRQIARCARD